MIERVEGHGLAGIVGLVLAEPGSGRVASRAQVAAYLEYLEHVRLRHIGFQIEEQGHCRGAVLALLLPGRTVVMMAPPPGELGTTLAAQTEVTRQAAEELLRERPHYLQTLLEPYCTAKHAVFRAARFEMLTRLQYLEAPVAAALPADSFTWKAYDSTTRAVFESLVARTYVGSQDCPELTRLRPESDALAAHQSSGEFEPELWELCQQDGVTVGCLLCSGLPGTDALEVVYMGVVPEARRRGVARRLLGRAAQHAAARRLTRLLLVVDERNAAARKLYARFGFRCTSVRDAFLRVGGPA